ncbi:hypothetical protein D3C87_103760 [compost metagenome]
MGLYMKYLLPIAMLFSLTSCLEQPDMSNDDGPQASVSDVQNALSNAWGDNYPTTMEKGEFVFKTRTQKIQDYTPRLVFQEGVTISEKDRVANKFNYTFLHQTEEITNTGESKLSTTEHHMELDAPSSLMAQDVKTQSLSFGVQTILGLMQVCIKSEDLQKECDELAADKCDLRCHNLTVTETKVPVPELARQRENCAGVPNCELKMKNVAFDLILEIKKGNATEKQKVRYMTSISRDVPYMSRLMNYCYRGLVQPQGTSQKVLVTVCNDVKDFRPGTQQ